jgi:RNA polymerase sigma-70 factor (ECF subfamily)
VLRNALILTANHAEAEDLAQEVLLKAFRAIDQYRDGSNMMAWLMAILRNCRIDRLRAAGVRPRDVSLEQLALDPAAPPPGESSWQSPQEALAAFSDQQVIQALGALPEDIRWTLLLVDVQDWPQQDVAQLLGVPVGTIKSRLHRGRAMLREALLPLARQMRLAGDASPS